MAETRQILRVDLGGRESQVERFEVEEHHGLGGKVLAIRLMERYLDPRVDPLSPENVVILTPSPIAAWSFPGSNRLGAFTKGPLTGAWLECYVGGTISRICRETGWDAVVVTGAASEPVRLHVTAEGAAVLPADGLWGLDAFAVHEMLSSQLDKRSAVLAIGVAGENQVRIASVMHDRAHTLGRGGLGAVFGSKRLKALTVTSSGPVHVDASERFSVTRRAVSKWAAEAPGSRGLRTFGTPVMVGVVSGVGGFPTGYWQKGRSPYQSGLEAEGWPAWARVDSEACPPCPMHCRKVLTPRDGDEAGRRLHGPEFETLFSFGGCCKVEHARDVVMLNEHCNRLGLDTMSAGQLMSFIMWARDLGLVQEAPGWGDAEAISGALTELATVSTAHARLWAGGTARVAKALGMDDQAIVIKGMDPSGYDPRAIASMGLGFALNPRGGCHLRTTFFNAEFLGLLKDKDPDEYVEVFIDYEDRLLLQDSLIVCRFYRNGMNWDDYLSAIEQLGDAPVTEGQLRSLCTETLTRIRRFNFACGLTPADDSLPRRLFVEATDTAPPVDRADFERKVSIYWRRRGWGADGHPPVAEEDKTHEPRCSEAAVARAGGL